MKPSHIKMVLAASIKAKRPVYIHGSPGVGKSRVVADAVAESGGTLRDVRVSLLDPVDLRGLPTVDNGMAKWAIPEFLPDAKRDGPKGTLLLDELSSAPPSVQTAAYQLVLDRKLGEYTLPEGWSVVAAGNKATDRAVVQKMSKALANRFTHVEFEIDVKDWVSWALAHGVRTEVIAFIRYRPELLHDFDPSATEHAFASPRSWEFVSDFLEAGPAREIENAVYAGTVGEGPAAEFTGFLRIYRNLPDPAMILMSPGNAPVPEDPATLYATCGSLAWMATEDNFDRVTEYAARMPAEFGVLMVRDSARFAPEVQSTRPFLDWAARNRDVLL